MLSAGPEQVIRPASVVVAEDSGAVRPSIWQRMPVAPGIELHLREDLPKLKPGELQKLLAALETALRRGLR